MAIAGRLARTPSSLFGLAVMTAVLVMVAFAPLVAPADPSAQDITARLLEPFETSDRGMHWLGTDPLGRDIASRIIFGARISMLVGVVAVVIAGAVGVTLGLAAGYAGRGWDALIMRVADVQLALPFLVLALALVAAVGPSLTNLIIVLGLTGWVIYARVIRAETLSLREREFVLAARAVGAGGLRIVARHILPNATSSIIVVATLHVARMILFEASLSFLGVGVPPPTPTWGGMIADGRGYLTVAWWVSTLPGLALFLTVLGVTLIGDRLRDVLDPRIRDVEGAPR
jgi:peptide/nickel transport system permease protein